MSKKNERPGAWMSKRNGRKKVRKAKKTRKPPKGLPSLVPFPGSVLKLREV